MKTNVLAMPRIQVHYLPVHKTFRRSHQIIIDVAEVVQRNTAAKMKKRLDKQIKILNSYLTG